MILLVLMKLFFIATAATAQAPEPQARVSPTPLSQTRTSIILSETTLANSTLVLLGKNG